MSRGRLIEAVDGVPIYAKAKAADLDPLALAPGRRGRLTPGGPVVEVDRIGQGAVYVHKVYDPPMERQIGPWDKIDDLAKTALAAIETGTPQEAFVAAFHLAEVGRKCGTIYATRGPAEPGISRSARFVERLPDGPPPETAPAPAPKRQPKPAPEPKPAGGKPTSADYRACSEKATAAGFAPGMPYNGKGYWKALRAWCEATGKAEFPR